MFATNCIMSVTCLLCHVLPDVPDRELLLGGVLLGDVSLGGALLPVRVRAEGALEQQVAVAPQMELKLCRKNIH